MTKYLSTDEELLISKVRKIDDEELNLETFSYSKLDLFEQCRQKYYLKYILKNFDKSDAIHLSLGTLAHRVLEEKGNMLINGQEVNYSELQQKFENGFYDTNEKSKENIEGLNEIKKRFFEDFYTKDNKSGMDYQEKTQLFINTIVKEEMEDENWKVFKTEYPFDFAYKYGENEDGSPKEIRIHGFIDRLDINEQGDIRCIDYKTSKSKYDDKKMATPLQMAIYSLAIYNDFGKLPVEHQYDFIFINEFQQACTKGYIKRACKKLDKLLNEIDELEKSKKYKPTPSPLCYFCPMCVNNPNADNKTKYLCEYYSLWTPNEKTFSVNKVWSEEEKENGSEQYKKDSAERPKRKLIF